jgi:hypothetical protein
MKGMFFLESSRNGEDQLPENTHSADKKPAAKAAMPIRM